MSHHLTIPADCAEKAVPYPALADLADRWALVVGDSGGLGGSYAKALLARRAKVIVVDAASRLVRPAAAEGDQRCITLDPLLLTSPARCRVLLGQLGIRISLLALCDAEPPAGGTSWDLQHRIASLLAWCGAFRSSLMLLPRGAVIIASNPDAAPSAHAELHAARRRIAHDLQRTWSRSRLHVQSVLAPQSRPQRDSLAGISLDHLPDGDREITPDTPAKVPTEAAVGEDEDLELLRLIFADPQPRRRTPLTRAG